jgi:hypothetical protein
MIAVDFDDEVSRHASEVRKVTSNRMLPPEFDAVHAERAT